MFNKPLCITQDSNAKQHKHVRKLVPKLRRNFASFSRSLGGAMDRRSFLLVDGSYLFKGSLRFRGMGQLDYQLVCKYLAEQVGLGQNADGFAPKFSHTIRAACEGFIPS